jgi:hypothetical protein
MKVGQETPGDGRDDATRSHTTRDFLDAAQQALRTAEFALGDLKGSSDRWVSGMSNVAVWGHAVTSALARLKSRVPGFEEVNVPPRGGNSGWTFGVEIPLT